MVTIASGAILLGCGSGSCGTTSRFAYFANSGNNSYTQCLVNSSDGTLSACNTVTPDGQGQLSSPSGITISNGYAYFANLSNTGTYTQCSVNSSNGILSDTCTTKDIPPTNPITAFKGTYGFTISNGYAYIVTNSVVLVLCTVDSSNGSLGSCSSDPGAPPIQPSTGITINNEYAYLISSPTTNNSYTQCTVGQGGTFTAACSDTINNPPVTPGAPGQLDGPSGLTISNGYAYFTNKTGNSYTQCAVNSADGTLSACNTVTPGAPGLLDAPTGVSISNGYAYFANSGDNSYTKCAVNSSNGTLSACNTVIPDAPGQLDSPSGITVN